MRQQFYSIARITREAKHEGRKGVSYADLVTQALLALPGRSAPLCVFGGWGAEAEVLEGGQGSLTLSRPCDPQAPLALLGRCGWVGG